MCKEAGEDRALLGCDTDAHGYEHNCVNRPDCSWQNCWRRSHTLLFEGNIIVNVASLAMWYYAVPTAL